MADLPDGEKITAADLEMAQQYVDLAGRVLDVSNKFTLGRDKRLAKCQLFAAHLFDRAMVKTKSPARVD